MSHADDLATIDMDISVLDDNPVETFNVSMELDSGSDSSTLYDGSMDLDVSVLNNTIEDVLAIDFEDQPPPPTFAEKLQRLNDQPLREMPHIVIFATAMHRGWDIHSLFRHCATVMALLLESLTWESAAGTLLIVNLPDVACIKLKTP